MFTADDKGNFKQWYIDDQNIYKNWGKIHEGSIKALAITTDNKFLFTADLCSNLKQWNLKKAELEFDYGKPHSGAPIYSICITSDDKF